MEKGICKQASAVSEQAAGVGLDNTKPLSSNGLSVYVARRGQKMGYASEITYYSFRHGTLNALNAAIGPGPTRRIAGHPQRTSTLEDDYLDEATPHDLNAIVIPDEMEQDLTQENLLAWTTLPPEKIAEIDENAERLVDQYMEIDDALKDGTEEMVAGDLESDDEDDGPAEDESRAHEKRQRRHYRIQARNTLLEEAQEERLRLETVESMQARRAVLAADSALVACIKTMLADGESASSQGSTDYARASRYFLQILQDSTMSTYRPNAGGVCPKCAQDDTIGAAAKAECGRRSTSHSTWTRSSISHLRSWTVCWKLPSRSTRTSKDPGFVFIAKPWVWSTGQRSEQTSGGTSATVSRRRSRACRRRLLRRSAATRRWKTRQAGTRRALGRRPSSCSAYERNDEQLTRIHMCP